MGQDQLYEIQQGKVLGPALGSQPQTVLTDLGKSGKRPSGEGPGV